MKTTQLPTIISKQEAIELGLKRYFTNISCMHGHFSERSVSEGKCYECMNLRARKARKANPEKFKEFEKKRYPKRKITEKKQRRNRYLKNREEILLKAKEEYSQNKEEIIKRNVAYKKRWRETPNGILVEFIRRSVHRVIDSIKKGKNISSLKLVKYTTLELKKHIESKFLPGMNWNNHGSYFIDGKKTWQLDHKISISKILKIHKYKSQDEIIIIANSLENLQPLWAIDNLKKGNR